jgi:membrane protease YdiL (CAAX protease family)
MIQGINERIALGLERMNMGIYVGIFVALKIALAYVSEQIYFALTNDSIATGSVEIGNIYFSVFAVAMLGPLIETYLVQYLFFKHLLGRISLWWIVILSAFVFALFHTYNIGYVFYAFFSGLILSTSYALRLRSNPFVSTLLIHSVYNLLGFIYNYWH